MEPAAQVFQKQLLELVVRNGTQIENRPLLSTLSSVAGEIPKLLENDFNEMAV